MENKKQPIKFWFNQMEEPERSQALNNVDEFLDQQLEKSISDALCGAFYWNETPEGGEYWVQIQEKYKKTNKQNGKSNN